jgi:GT2 family glycosyltransferase
VTEPGISVIVPVRDGGEAFARCLAGLTALDPAPLEVLVVDDGSRDASADAAKGAGARVVTMAATRGPAAARNLGARHARGDVLFFVDADVAVRPDAIAHVARALEDVTVAGVIGSYDATPGATNFLSQYKNLAHRYWHQIARTDGFTFWGACGAIRASAFHAVSGFDERYTAPSIEDIELGYRLRRAGLRVRVDPTLEVTHLKRWTAASLIRTDFAARALPWSELIFREGRIDDDLNLQTRARLGVAGTWLLVLCAVLAFWIPQAAWAAVALVEGLLLLDLPLWRYFARLRGVAFAAATVPWQWLQYACSGVAFGLAGVRHLLKGPRTRRMERPA